MQVGNDKLTCNKQWPKLNRNAHSTELALDLQNFVQQRFVQGIPNDPGVLYHSDTDRKRNFVYY